MHASDVLMYGHFTFMRTLEAFPVNQRTTGGTVGYWSVKDLVAHLASFELVLVEVLQNVVAPCPTPLRDALTADGQAFNDRQVDVLRKDWSYEQCLEEYLAAHEQVRGLVSKLPTGLLQQTGAIPWYGEEYDLEDLITYMYYGHKREHSGQIQTFRDRFR